MIINKHFIWVISGYGITLIILLYFGLNGLIMTAASASFPNIKFISILATLIVISWSLGLAIRRYITNFPKKIKERLTTSFLLTTIVSWFIVLILFTVT